MCGSTFHPPLAQTSDSTSEFGPGVALQAAVWLWPLISRPLQELCGRSGCRRLPIPHSDRKGSEIALVGSAVEIPSEARPPGNFFQSDLQAPRTLLHSGLAPCESGWRAVGSRLWHGNRAATGSTHPVIYAIRSAAHLSNAARCAVYGVTDAGSPRRQIRAVCWRARGVGSQAE